MLKTSPSLSCCKPAPAPEKPLSHASIVRAAAAACRDVVRDPSLRYPVLATNVLVDFLATSDHRSGGPRGDEELDPRAVRRAAKLNEISPEDAEVLLRAVMPRFAGHFQRRLKLEKLA